MAIRIGELFLLLRGQDELTPTMEQAHAAAMAFKIAAGAAFAAVGKAAWDAGNKFRLGMANVSTLIPGETKRVKELGSAVQDLQIQLGNTSEDLTGGLYQILSAYGNNADTLKSLEMNAKAAKAGVASTVDAINLTSAVTKAFGDTSMEAQKKVADLALLTVRLGQTTFPELAASIGQTTPQAKNLGVAQEELFAVFATLTGVTGGAAEVATQLGGALEGLMAPTDSTIKLMQSLGYENGAAMIAGMGLQGALKAIADEAVKTKAPLQDFMGSSEGQTVVLGLAGAQAQDYATKLQAMGKAAGTTEEAFSALKETMGQNANIWDKAKATYDVFLQKMGDIAPVMMAVGSITAIIEVFKLLRGAIQGAIIAHRTLMISMGGIGLAVAAVGTAVGYLYNTYEEGANAVSDYTKALDGERTRLEAIKSQRTTLASQLGDLATKYDDLASRTEKAADIDQRMDAVKAQIADRMGQVNKLLGEQAGKWDGTTASIQRAIAALQDMSALEKQQLLATARFEESQAWDKVSNYRTENPTANDVRMLTQLGMKKFVEVKIQLAREGKGDPAFAKLVADADMATDKHRKVREELAKPIQPPKTTTLTLEDKTNWSAYKEENLNLLAVAEKEEEILRIRRLQAETTDASERMRLETQAQVLRAEIDGINAVSALRVQWITKLAEITDEKERTSLQAKMDVIISQEEMRHRQEMERIKERGDAAVRQLEREQQAADKVKNAILGILGSYMYGNQDWLAGARAMGDLQGVSIGSLTGTLPTRAMIPNVPALVAGGTSGAGTVTLVLPDGWDAQMDERAKRVVQVERTRAARRLVEGGI